MNTGLVFNHDGLNYAEAMAVDQLAESGDAPTCVFVGVDGGHLEPTVDGGTVRSLRMNAYDIYSEKFPDFVVDEFLPYVISEYGLKIADSPDMHLVTGGSSGGISSWNIAWHRTDYFHRVYMSSPSFLSMGNGDELLALMRKFETKPIRVYTEFSENEPDDYFGSSVCAAVNAERALKFAKYDMMSEYYPDEGHCSRRCETEDAKRRMSFLWKNWDTMPIVVKEHSPRVAQVIEADSLWQDAKDRFPHKREAVSDGEYTLAGRYVADGSKIIFETQNGERKIVADCFEEISSLQISADKWRLYIGDYRRGCVYAATIEKDGSLNGIYCHGSLHLKTDFAVPGALDLCVDSEDRLYVATEIGIQTIRSFGLSDAILVNPEGNIAEKIVISADGYLYAMTADKVYKRRLKDKKPSDEGQSEPVHTSYYN